MVKVRRWSARRFREMAREKRVTMVAISRLLEAHGIVVTPQAVGLWAKRGNPGPSQPFMVKALAEVLGCSEKKLTLS